MNETIKLTQLVLGRFIFLFNYLKLKLERKIQKKKKRSNNCFWCHGILISYFAMKNNN